MPYVDYFVATMEFDDHVNKMYNLIYRQLGEGEMNFLYGFKVKVVDRVGIGSNPHTNRAIVYGTGPRAQDAMSIVMTISPSVLSIARIDIQATMVVHDADGAVSWAQPAKAYKAVMWHAIGERGSTLYIGAPSSNARMRIYNKTAESGQSPGEGLEYLRVEVQLRNRYADQAYKAIAAGNIEAVWQKWVRQMLHNDCATAMITRALGGECAFYALHPEEKEDWVARRKRWFETVVAPSLRRLIAADPDYLETIIATFVHEPSYAAWLDRSRLREMDERDQ